MHKISRHFYALFLATWRVFIYSFFIFKLTKTYKKIFVYNEMANAN